MDSANAASAALPNNKSSLGQRVISALILLPIVVVAVWWSVWSVVAIVVLAAVIGLIELYGAFSQAGYRPRRAVGMVGAVLLIAAFALVAVGIADLVIAVVTLLVIGSLMFELTRHGEQNGFASWALTLAGALYISCLLGHFILLRALQSPGGPGALAAIGMNLDSGAAWIVVVLAVTWIQDTAAYFAGKYLGRHKMAPRLSPKKTWEGAIGGLLGSIVAGVAFVLLLGLPLSVPQAALLGIVGGVVGPLGDLAESMIKRQVGLKDAGNLIPGHGGILDRADSLLFTGPVLYYLIKLFLM